MLDRTTSILAFLALVAVCALGWVPVDQFMTGERKPAPNSSASARPNDEVRTQFSMCRRDRYNCVVDGDTVWFRGQNLRLQSYDTPQPYDDICGGTAEVAPGKRASARLLQLLNGNPFTVQTGGTDNTGSRALATACNGILRALPLVRSRYERAESGHHN